MADSKQTNNKRRYNNTPNIQGKGNLTKDPVGPFTSRSGREYLVCTIANNNISLDSDITWYPRVFFYEECMAVAKTLKKGDFIAYEGKLLPSETQKPWVNDKGETLPQSSAIMIFPLPVRQNGLNKGVTIPVTVIKRKVQPTPVETEAKVGEQKELPLAKPETVVADKEMTEEEVLATIGL